MTEPDAALERAREFIRVVEGDDANQKAYKIYSQYAENWLKIDGTSRADKLVRSIAAAIREERQRVAEELEVAQLRAQSAEAGWRAAEKRAADLEERLIDITAKSVSNCQAAAALEAALRDVLASAYPNSKEHPTMYAAWRSAEALLADHAGALAEHDAAVRKAALLEAKKAIEELARSYGDQFCGHAVGAETAAVVVGKLAEAQE